MPVFGDRTGKRGALHVRFRVCFPHHLSPQQQHMLRQALAEPSAQQVHAQAVPGVVAAAVATMAGLQPRPTATLPMLPPSPTAAQQQQLEQDEQQEQHGQRKDEHATAGAPWTGGSSWRQQHSAAVGLSESPHDSSSSAWTAAAVSDSGGSKGRASAFVHAAGVAAASITSSSSAAGLAASMQTTGSSQEAWVFGCQKG